MTKALQVVYLLDAYDFSKEIKDWAKKKDVLLINSNNLDQIKDSIIDDVVNEIEDTLEIDWHIIDCIFLSNHSKITSDSLDTAFDALSKKNFTCTSGYNPKIPQNLYFEEGAALSRSDDKSQLILPHIHNCGIRITKNLKTLSTYNRFLRYRHLDIELAAIAIANGSSFSIVSGEISNESELYENCSKYLREKAAVWNCVFLFNCFDLETGKLLTARKPFQPAAKQSLRNGKLTIETIKKAKISRRTDLLNSKQYNQITEKVRKNPERSILRDLFRKRFSNQENVYFSLTSIPSRINQLKITIKSILKYADKVFVYLNGYHEVPDFLIHEKIVVQGINEPDLNASGKVAYLRNENVDGFMFIIDDDIVYPSNYVKKMIETLEKYDRKVVACVHGSIFPRNFQWYYERTRIFPMRHALVHDFVCNLPGSGAIAFHTSTLSLDFNDFRPYTMVDLCFAIVCAEQKVPVISVARKKGWLKLQETEFDLFAQFNTISTIQSPIAIDRDVWNFENVCNYALPIIESALEKYRREHRTDKFGNFDIQFLAALRSGKFPNTWYSTGHQYNQSQRNLIGYLKECLKVSNTEVISELDMNMLPEISTEFISELESLSILINSLKDKYFNVEFGKSEFKLFTREKELFEYLRWSLLKISANVDAKTNILDTFLTNKSKSKSN